MVSRHELAHEIGADKLEVVAYQHLPVFHTWQDTLDGRIAARELTQQLQRLSPQGATEGSLFVPNDYEIIPLLQ